MAFLFKNTETFLSPENPYFRGKIFNADSNTPELVREFVDWQGDEGDRFHLLKHFEELDFIADKYYDGLVESPWLYWWLIADANQIENPFDITSIIGSELVIPNIIRFLNTRNKQ